MKHKFFRKPYLKYNTTLTHKPYQNILKYNATLSLTKMKQLFEKNSSLKKLNITLFFFNRAFKMEI